MECLLQTVCSLVLLLLLYSLLEMLLPSGALSRFIKLVMGLTLLAAALLPLSRTLPLPEAGPQLAPAMAAFREQGADYAALGQEIGRRLTEADRQEQEAALAAQLAALAGLVSGVEQARARVSLDQAGLPQQVVLYIQAADLRQAGPAAQELICGFYSIEQQRVEWRSWEEYHE